jgi:hypothetical protein
MRVEALRVSACHAEARAKLRKATQDSSAYVRVSHAPLEELARDYLDGRAGLGELRANAALLLGENLLGGASVASVIFDEWPRLDESRRVRAHWVLRNLAPLAAGEGARVRALADASAEGDRRMLLDVLAAIEGAAEGMPPRR